MRDVAIASFAQHVLPKSDFDEVELLAPVVAEALEAAGLTRRDVGFTISGSCDYLGGRPFSFVTAVDALGAWPPISESHVEMDGAFALYEAWVRLQHGDVDVALVYAFGKPSQGNLHDVLTTQLDPYYLAPLGVDQVALAALQARAMLDAGRATERQMAEIALSRRRDAKAVAGDATVEQLLERPYVASPLRAHDCADTADGVAAAVLVAGDRAKRAGKPVAWIRGIDHRIEAHSLGARDLTRSESTALAAAKAGAKGIRADVLEIHAPFSHQEILVRDALEVSAARVNPSGGALAANPFIVTGLARIGEAARRVMDSSARTAVAHATSGPCLQQNLVCVLEAS